MNSFFTFFCWVLMLPWLGLRGETHLDRLVEYDQETCAQVLQSAELSDLWDYFLKGQADLYYSQEAELLAGAKGWADAQDVLEIGSGNGAYLNRLSEIFAGKTYLGIEKRSSYVEQSKAQFAREGLAFLEGDAEVAYEEYQDRFDAILYRLTLQHLQNPKLSLELAHRYLKEGGHVMIIDSYDPAKCSSHEIPSFDEASREHNERNKATLKGNRRITIEILEELESGKGSLCGLYEVSSTSLDVQGNRLMKGMRFESEQDRKRYFNHALLFLAILNKGYGVTVDLSKAYEELRVYLNDAASWICPGMHFLVLKKKGSPI